MNIYVMKTLYIFLSFLIVCYSGWVDPDTPLDKKTIVSYTDGKTYDLVMSDEFEKSGRTFKDGHDPMWTGI